MTSLEEQRPIRSSADSDNDKISPGSSPVRSTSSRKYWLGLLYLFLMITTWVGSSFFIQVTETDFTFHGVFFTTYTCNLAFSSILLCRWALNRFRALPGDCHQVSVWQYVRWSTFYGPMWFMMNVCVNYSLKFTSVASNNCLSTLSSAFSLFAAFFITRTVPNLCKVFAVVITYGIRLILLESDHLQICWSCTDLSPRQQEQF
jgi:hypothetical protein